MHLFLKNEARQDSASQKKKDVSLPWQLATLRTRCLSTPTIYMTADFSTDFNNTAHLLVML